MSFLIEKYGAKDLPETGTPAPSDKIPDPQATSDSGAEALARAEENHVAVSRNANLESVNAVKTYPTPSVTENALPLEDLTLLELRDAANENKTGNESVVDLGVQISAIEP